MRKNPRTILLAKIRRRLRQAKHWLNLERNWEFSKNKDMYSELHRAQKGIADAAESIVHEVVLHVRQEQQMIFHKPMPDNWLAKLLWRFIEVRVVNYIQR